MRRTPCALPCWIALQLMALGAVMAVPMGAPAVASAQPLVVLDPGHGGSDPGAVGCGLEEEDAVLDVALRLRGLLEAAGVRVTMTRDTDVSVGLSARAALANSMGADVFVSNHSNSNAGTPASGTETWVANAASARSVELANLLQDAMVAAWGLPDRGVKYADFVVVRDTSMPAALAELAFTNRCMPDAELLASDTSRQAIAEAEAEAILAWLGIDEPTRNGTLRGVVFEDQGVGAEDTSVRIPGAMVVVTPGTMSASAASPDASFLFVVPAGTYTVEASAASHVTASRTCTVTAGAETWCSVGLFPEGGVDAGGVEVDVGVAVEDVGAGATDAGTAEPRAGGCACRAGRGGEHGGAGWLALGVALLVTIRRRTAGVIAIAFAALVGTSGCAEHDDGTSSALVRAERSAHAALTVVRDDAMLAIVDVTPIDAPGLERPVIAPDGSSILATPRDGSALYLVDVATREVRQLVEGAHVGIEPRFLEGGAIGFRDRHQSDTAVPAHAVDRLGAEVAVRATLGSSHVFVEHGDGEDVVVLAIRGAREVIARGDRHLTPAVSADGAWTAVWGVERGVVLHAVGDGAEVVIGDPLLDDGLDEGAEAHFGHPRFDPTGRYLAFERTVDDGHVFVAGSLMIADLSRRPIRLARIEAPGTIARQPALSAPRADGTMSLAFTTEDGIAIATVRPAS